MVLVERQGALVLMTTSRDCMVSLWTPEGAHVGDFGKDRWSLIDPGTWRRREPQHAADDGPEAEPTPEISAWLMHATARQRQAYVEAEAQGEARAATAALAVDEELVKKKRQKEVRGAVGVRVVKKRQEEVRGDARDGWPSHGGATAHVQLPCPWYHATVPHLMSTRFPRAPAASRAPCPPHLHRGPVALRPGSELPLHHWTAPVQFLPSRAHHAARAHPRPAQGELGRNGASCSRDELLTCADLAPHATSAVGSVAMGPDTVAWPRQRQHWRLAARRRRKRSSCRTAPGWAPGYTHTPRRGWIVNFV